MPQSSYMASVAWASRPVHRPKSTPRSRRARIAATVRGDTVCRLVSSVPSISQNTALMWLKVASMGAFLGCAAVWGVFANGVHGIPRHRRGLPKQNHHKGACPFVVAWPGRKPSQHSTLFGKNAVFIECCDGFTALRHDQNAGVQTAATPREPPSRPYPPLRASAARQMSPPATGQSPAAPRRRTYCQSP